MVYPTKYYFLLHPQSVLIFMGSSVLTSVNNIVQHQLLPRPFSQPLRPHLHLSPCIPLTLIPDLLHAISSRYKTRDHNPLSSVIVPSLPFPFSVSFPSIYVAIILISPWVVITLVNALELGNNFQKGYEVEDCKSRDVNGREKMGIIVIRYLERRNLTGKWKYCYAN